MGMSGRHLTLKTRTRRRALDALIRRLRPQANDDDAALAPPCGASMALTEFQTLFQNAVRWVPSTKPSKPVP